MAQGEKILVVDDDASYVELVEFVLTRSGYEVIRAFSGLEALEKITQDPPALVISDVEMPGLTGFELAQKISEDVLMANIPIILMSAKRISSKDRVAGLGFGSDDYLVKPFAPKELLARVMALLRRKERHLDANPLSHLPGNSSILRVIEQHINEKTPFAVLYADLNNFKGFNDSYGFLKGDEVILFTAKVIVSAARSVSGDKDFVGHIGGDDFVVVTEPERATDICKAIIKKFDEGIVAYYNEKDRARGSFEVKDRRGNIIVYPLMGIAVGVVTSENREIERVGQVSQIGAEMKVLAKSLGGSQFCVDRRTKD